MAEGLVNLESRRIAVVTGANKGIGVEICKQLASKGIVVVLTARDEKRGKEALEKFRGSDLVFFHQLDVVDPTSVSSLANFVKTHFGKVDILVNNAGVAGVTIDADALKTSGITDNGLTPEETASKWKLLMTETYELAVQCIQTNYYGNKRIAEAFIPLLQLSNSPRIINVSASMGKLKYVSNEWAKGIFSDVENLSEERVDEVINKFLKDYKEYSLQKKGWPDFMPAYTISKAATSAYTRILAKKYPTFCINCCCPGFVKTDINFNTGILSVEDGAAIPVKLALLADRAPSGLFFDQNDENRGKEALEKIRGFGLSDFVAFHKLNVVDPTSIAFLADFVKKQFGKLDILVNNAGVVGFTTDADLCKASKINELGLEEILSRWNDSIITENYELAVQGLETNYFGAKRMVEAFIPLIQFSNSPRIVNVSGSARKLQNVSKEWAKGILGDVENLSEERVDEVINEFLKDYKEDSLQGKGWLAFLPAYTISKAAISAYTRILAKKYPTLCINCCCPGFVKTDINFNTGILSVEEGAANSSQASSAA